MASSVLWAKDMMTLFYADGVIRIGQGTLIPGGLLQAIISLWAWERSIGVARSS
eukprot:c3293_g1_i1 orf=111-272(+)